MLFKRSMCIFCNSKQSDDRMQIRIGALGVCRDCHDALPVTGTTHSFAVQRYADYIISPFYYKGALRDAMRRYKFNGCRAYGDVFAELIKGIISDIDALRDFDLIVPVPLSGKRMTERGYNQSAIIAKPVAEFLGLCYSETTLCRKRDTKRQSGLQNHERILNVKDAFLAADEVQGKNIIIFDDIYTSGSTMAECARTLKDAGAGRIAAMSAAIVYKPPSEAYARLRF